MRSLNSDIVERISLIRQGKVPKSYKEYNNFIIPHEWDLLKFGEIAEFKNGLNYGENDKGKSIKIVGVGDFKKLFYLDTRELSKIEFSNLGNDYLLKDGDLIFVRSNGNKELIGRVLYCDKVDEQVTFSGFTIRARVISNEFVDKYCAYYCSSKFVKKQYMQNGGGTNINNLSQGILAGIKITKPSIKEQEKITEIFDTWDKAIELKEKLLKEKQKQKKGLMERLLTGKIRVKGFNEGWKEVVLNKLFDRVTRKNSVGNSNVLTISAQQGLINQKKYFNKLVASDILDNYYFLNKGEFAYNKSYSNGYPMGAIKRLNDYEGGVVTTLYICFKLKDKFEQCSDFFEQYFESGLMNKGLTQIAYEGGRAHGLLNVSPSDFFALKVYIPSIEEQVKIANILRTCDNEIALIKNQIELLKQQKKGLMQLLLTGIVRVKCD